MAEKSLVHLLLEASSDGACVLDADGRVQAMNELAEKMTGYQEIDLLGRPFPGKLQISADASDNTHLWKHAPDRQWIGIRLELRDNKEFDALCFARRLGPNAASGILIKLRPENRPEGMNADLEDMKIKLEAIFGGMADGLVLIDEKGTVQLFSAGAERLFGFRAEEVIGENVKCLMPSPYQENHDAYLAAYRQSGIPRIIGIGREVSGRRKDGSIFPMYLSVGEVWLQGRRYFVGVTHDLTRAKIVEGRLWMLSAAVEQSPVAVMITDRDGRIEYVNSRFVGLTGYAEDELIGKNPRLLRSETPTNQYERLWATIGEGGEWRGEIQDRKKNGENYWAFEIITPLRNADGDIVHYLALQQDVTEQRHDKEALALSEERFRKVAEMVGEWLWEQDANGRYIYSSDAVRDILGIDPEALIGKTYLELFADKSGLDTTKMPAQPFHRVINCYRRRDGASVYTESTGAPIFDQQGGLVKWRGVDRDITAQKNFEDALRVRNRAMEAVRVGVVISDARDPKHPNIYVNPALSDITGYSRDELLKAGVQLLYGPGADSKAFPQFRRILTGGQSYEITLQNRRKNGELFWNEILISPVPDESGLITHYVSVQTDVTERRRAEQNRRDLEIAKQIQLSLLPSRPLRMRRAEVAGFCLPATHVGGDYFDYFENADGADLVIADVSGHNVGAALIMTEVRSMVRARCRQSASAHPSEILHDLNELLHDDLTKAELFITMFCCRFEPETLKLKYANGGHNPALLLHAGSCECAQLDGEGLVIGAKRSVTFEEKIARLEPGDKLLFYTDGVTEAQDASGEFFGLDRLCESFRNNRSLGPEGVMKALLRDVKKFCGQVQLSDDIAIVVADIK
ncbi:PAS domain S-box protein [Methylocystis sp. IM3]|uniref:PAS domain S-box protein n=1 Tax=unclassified Methylocystis TaxID=2625913 RepID=UPI0030F79594